MAKRNGARVRIIGVGIVPAIPAKELQIGDRFMRNNGYTYKILDILPNSSGRSITVVVEGETRMEKGRIYTRSFFTTTLVAKLGFIRDEPEPNNKNLY